MTDDIEHLRAALERAEAARVIFVQGLHGVVGTVDAAAKRNLDKISAAADRAWKTDPKTAQMKGAADPAADLVRLAEHTELLAEREAAQAALDRLDAVHMTAEGLTCQSCGLILFGTRAGRITALYRAAVEHATHRCGGGRD